MRAALPFACKDTAVSMTWYTVDAPWDGTAGGQQLPISDLVAIVLREPGNFGIIYFPNGSKTDWEYRFHDVNEGDSIHEQITQGEWFVWSHAECLSEFDPHDEICYPRQDFEGHDAFWVDTNPVGGSADSTVWTFHGLVVGAAYVFNVRRTINKKVEEFIGFGTADANGEITMDMVNGKSGYYSCRLETGQSSDMYITVAGNSSVFGHRHIPQFDEFVDAVENIAVTSATLMYTNTAAPLSRQGKRAQIQVPGGTDWPELFGLDEYIQYGGAPTTWTHLSKLPGCEVDDITEGAYSALKPTSINSYIRKPARADDLPPVVNVTPSDGYLVIYASIATTAGREGYWTLLGCTEFETLDQTRERAFPSDGTLRFQAAHDKLGPIKQHHTNAFHIDDLLGKAVGAVMSPYSTAISEGMGLLNTLLK